MPKTRAERAPTWRFCRKTVGLTYSCPVDVSHPVKSRDELRDILTDMHGPNLHEIAQELHKNGENHYHCWFKFDSEVDSENCRLFDVNGVHPNILKGKPGPGWRQYLRKSDTELLTNVESCPYRRALAASSVVEGMEILALSRPSDYLRFGQSMERNLRRRLETPCHAIQYYGPYLPNWFPHTWNPYTHSLLIWGESGINKTQFARYYMLHMVGDYDYVKGDHEAAKRLSGRKPFIHDEVNCLRSSCVGDNSREITDVENGGEVVCRNSNAYIPPGLPRIFISNMERPFRNPAESVYGRRVMSWQLLI